MNKRFLLSCIFVFSGFFSLFAFEWNEHIHDIAVSDDEEWVVLSSVLDDETKDDFLQESIWAVPGKMKWAAPEKLITFKMKGWTLPAVCYNKQNKSFLVFHTDWNGADENGFYEFKPVISEDKRSFWFERKFFHFPVAGKGKFYTNDYGIYFIQETFSNEYASPRLYKIISEESALTWQIPEALSSIEICDVNKDDNIRNATEHPLYDSVTPTSKGLIIEDFDNTDWWYFDCKTEKVRKFESKDAALNFAQKHENKNYMSLFICGIVILLIIILALLIFLIVKNQLRKTDAADFMSKKDVKKLIYDTQELERANISRNVHDSVIQEIRGVRIEAELLHVNEDSVARQTKIENMATDCVVKLRNICYNLTPAELATHIDGDNSRIELVSIIQTLIQQFTERTNIPCILKVDPDFEYPTFTKEVSLNLFRVVQEALNNIEKHSYATNTSIFLRTENHKMKIFITDDGIGFDTSVTKIHDDGLIHFGLQMMKDRMELINGKITFISGNNDGTEVMLEIGY